MAAATTPDASSGLPQLITASTRLVDARLDASNYAVWRKTVLMSLRGMDLDSHLLQPPPPETDAKFRNWQLADSKIFALLVNSMDRSVQDVSRTANTVKELWESLQLMYSDTNNLARVSDIIQRLINIRQQHRPFPQYFTEWKGLRDELHEIWPIPQTPQEATAQRDQFCLFGLLLGLDPEYSTTATEILASATQIDIPLVYHRLGKAQRPRPSPPPLQDSSAFLGRGGRASRPRGRGRGTGRGRQFCQHCGKPGHHIDNCWLLHGLPPQLPRQGQSAYADVAPAYQTDDPSLSLSFE